MRSLLAALRSDDGASNGGTGDAAARGGDDRVSSGWCGGCSRPWGCRREVGRSWVLMLCRMWVFHRGWWGSRPRRRARRTWACWARSRACRAGTGRRACRAAGGARGAGSGAPGRRTPACRTGTRRCTPGTASARRTRTSCSAPRACTPAARRPGSGRRTRCRADRCSHPRVAPSRGSDTTPRRTTAGPIRSARSACRRADAARSGSSSWCSGR